MLLSEAIEKFLNYQLIRKSRTSSTINTYRSALFKFVEWSGDMPISRVDIPTIDFYAEYVQSLNLKPKTLRNRLTAVRSFVKYLYAKELSDIRPESIDLPRSPDSEATFLNSEEQTKLLDACKTPLEKALTLTLLRSGVRISELLNIQTDDVYEGSIVIRSGKGQKPRLVFISEDATLAIKLYHHQLGFRPLYLISDRSGQRISRQYAHRLVVGVADRANIRKNITPHTLRHTYATNMLKAGAKIQDVQKLLGHANIQNTLIYLHFTDDYLKEEYEKTIARMAMV